MKEPTRVFSAPAPRLEPGAGADGANADSLLPTGIQPRETLPWAMGAVLLGSLCGLFLRLFGVSW